MSVERNAPCPCGSGKKYKKCCLNNGMTTRLTGTGPSELVKKRVAAFSSNDFGFIFDTYHPDSNFRLQFPSRADYITYGQSTLNDDYQICSCQILSERDVEEHVAQVLFLLTVEYQGQQQEYFELSEFHRRHGQWYYLHSHRLERHEFNGSPDEMTCERMLEQGICF
nr:YchJ family metal-binding protein [uncultured Desulfuromonas sp.]